MIVFTSEDLRDTQAQEYMLEGEWIEAIFVVPPGGSGRAWVKEWGPLVEMGPGEGGRGKVTYVGRVRVHLETPEGLEYQVQWECLTFIGLHTPRLLDTQGCRG